MEKNNSTVLVIVIGVIALVAPVLLFTSLFMSSGNDASAQGASAAQPLNVSNPAHVQAVDALNTMLDPLKAISQKAESVDLANVALDGLKVKLETGQPPFCTMTAGKCVALSEDIQGKVQVEFNKLDSYLNLLQTKAQNPNNKTDITDLKKKIDASLMAIQAIVFGGEGKFVDLTNVAQKVINYNQSNGNIPWGYAGVNISMDGTKEHGVDCSGFMTYLLKKSGVLSIGASRLSTKSIIGIPKGFTLITKSKTDYKSLIMPGDLIVKSVTNPVTQVDYNWHVGMYMGDAAFGSTKNIIESTGTQRIPRPSFSGPQYSSINSFTSQNWLNDANSNIWVVRPPYR